MEESKTKLCFSYEIITSIVKSVKLVQIKRNSVYQDSLVLQDVCLLFSIGETSTVLNCKCVRALAETPSAGWVGMKAAGWARISRVARGHFCFCARRGWWCAPVLWAKPPKDQRFGVGRKLRPWREGGCFCPRTAVLSWRQNLIPKYVRSPGIIPMVMIKHWLMEGAWGREKWCLVPESYLPATISNLRMLLRINPQWDLNFGSVSVL